MPKPLIKNLSIWGAVFAIVLGSFIHFVYDWSGNNFLVSLVAPINESPWEHMKLVFTPLILFGFVDFYFLKIHPERSRASRGRVERAIPLCFALLKEIGVAIAFILAVFYLYASLTGYSILAVDITSFVIGIILAKWIGYKILIGNYTKWEFNGLNTIFIVLLILIAAFFIYATISPPHVNLFQDPVTTTYGIYKQ